jgi:dTDP-4-amino-4,6-dideoxygalactose transaminase
MAPKGHYRVVGGNFRLDALQAAVLRANARHLPAWTEARRRNAARYRVRLGALEAEGVLRLPVEKPDCLHVFNQFVVRAADRDGLRAFLAEAGIGTEVYYPVPLHRQECFRSLGYGDGEFPHATAAARDSLALPIYGELTEAQQDRVADAVARFFQRSR